MTNKKTISPIQQVLCTPNLTGQWLKTWIQNLKITSLLVKSSFRARIFFHLKVVLLFLNRATIRLLLLVREKEHLILTFTNIYVTLDEIHGSI